MTLTDARTSDPMARKKRNDEPAKIDAEVLRVARIVAAYRNVPLAEYISERLRPMVNQDHEEEVRKLKEEGRQSEPAPPPADRPTRKRPSSD